MEQKVLCSINICLLHSFKCCKINF